MPKTPIGNRPGSLPLPQVNTAGGQSRETDGSTGLSPDAHMTAARSRGSLVSGGATGLPEPQVVPQPESSSGRGCGTRGSPYIRYEQMAVRTGEPRMASTQQMSAPQRMTEGRNRERLLQLLKGRVKSSSALGMLGGYMASHPVTSVPARGATPKTASTRVPSAATGLRGAVSGQAQTPRKPLLVYQGRQFPGAPPVPQYVGVEHDVQNAPVSAIACHDGQQTEAELPVLPDSVPPAAKLHESLPMAPVVSSEHVGPEDAGISNPEDADVLHPDHGELLDTTRKILEEHTLGDCMTTFLPYARQVRVAAHMRKALGLEYRTFCDIHARYCRATASSGSLEAFYFSLQNMCDAARRAPGLHTGYVRMIDSDGLIRRYEVALPHTVPLAVVTQVVGDDLFGAMSIREQPDGQALLSASQAVQERGLRWRMQCTMGYGYVERMTAVCDAYRRDTGIRLSHEQLYMGLMSLCYKAGGFTREGCIERLNPGVLARFTQALQVQGAARGEPLGGIERYFVWLADCKWFVVLASQRKSPAGNDPLGQTVILYKPGWPQIGDACKRLAESWATWNINWR